jgi:hypothetical protein
MNANEVLAPQIAKALDDVAATGVLIPGRADISNYLLRHPDTTAWLVGLARAAREQLPPNAQLSLELYRDPESDDAYLTLYFRQRKYTPGLMDRADAIMAQFEHEIEACSGWILLTTDFHPPR